MNWQGGNCRQVEWGWRRWVTERPWKGCFSCGPFPPCSLLPDPAMHWTAFFQRVLPQWCAASSWAQSSGFGHLWTGSSETEPQINFPSSTLFLSGVLITVTKCKLKHASDPLWLWHFLLKFIFPLLSASWTYFSWSIMLESLKSALAFPTPLSSCYISHNSAFLIHPLWLSKALDSGWALMCTWGYEGLVREAQHAPRGSFLRWGPNLEQVAILTRCLL